MFVCQAFDRGIEAGVDYAVPDVVMELQLGAVDFGDGAADTDEHLEVGADAQFLADGV